MKNLFLFALMFVAIAISGCSKDSGDNSSDNSGGDYNEEMRSLLIGTWRINDNYLLGGDMTSYNLTITFNSDGTYSESLSWYWTANNTQVGNEDDDTSYLTGRYSFNDDVLYLSGHISAFSETGEYKVYKLTSSALWVDQFFVYQDTVFKFGK